MRSLAAETAASLSASLLVLSCWSEGPPEWKDGSPAGSESSGAFFNAGALRDGGDDFLREWYSKRLSAAGEPPLRGLFSAVGYRFMHLPSFRHPVLIRVESRPNERFIVVKELGGTGGYDPGEIVLERHRRLTSAEWREIESAVDGMRFWSLPKHQCEGRDHPDDGMVWILEGKTKDEYAVVQWHWDDCYACRHLIDLAEVELESLTRSEIEQTLPFVPLPPEIGW